MITRAFILSIILLVISTSKSFTNELKPLRITIHPSKINKNVIGSSTTIINYETIKKSSYKTLGDLLSKYSGVFFENLYYGSDAKSTVKIRGFGEQASRNIMVLVNGIRLSDMTIAGANLSRIPIDNVYEIEIIKGGSSGVLFGDGAVGGAINIITKNPKFIDNNITFKSSAKSFNTEINSININKKVDDIVLQTFASSEKSSGYRQNNKFENDIFEFNATYLKDPLTRFFTGIGFSDQYTGLPGSIIISDYYTRPRYVRSGNLDSFGSDKIKSWKIGSENILESSKFSNVIKYEEKDQKTSSMYQNVNIKAKTDLSTYTLSSKVNQKFNSDSINSELRLGIDYYNSSYRAVGNNYLGTPYHNIAKQKIFEPFSILRLSHSSVSNLEYELGFRLHYYDIDADNYLTRKSLLSNDRHNYAWSMGLNYNIQNQGDIFAHISRAFRSPRLDELISLVSPSPSLTDLEHQFSNDLEVGYEKENKDSRYKLAIFRSLIKNQIVYNSAAFANQNFDPSIQQGLEIEFDKSINEKFNLKSNAAYIDSYFSKGTEKGNETPYVPKLSSSISLYYYLENESDLSLEHKYIGKQRAGNDPNYNVRKSKSYQITDLNFTHKIKNFRLKASVNNVFNKKYYTNLIASGSGDAYVYPQPGRTLFLGLEATF